MMKVTHVLLISAISALSFSASAATAMQNSTPTQASSKTDNLPTPTIGSGPDISGSYTCSGADSQGKNTYTNPVTIAKNTGTFTFQWLNSSGYPYNLGTGMYNPNVSKAVSVVFWDPKKPDVFGTIMYAIKPNGTLAGNWAMQGSNDVGSENCSRNK